MVGSRKGTFEIANIYQESKACACLSLFQLPSTSQTAKLNHHGASEY
jgi:hypothetical protein